MKKLLLKTGLLMAVASVATAVTLTRSLSVALADILIIGADTVTFTGVAHVVTQVFPNDPLSPGDPYFPSDPIRVQINLHNVVGLGESGAKYQLLGSGVAEGVVAADRSISVSVEGFILTSGGKPFLPPNPIRVSFTSIPGSGLGDVFGSAEAHLEQ